MPRPWASALAEGRGARPVDSRPLGLTVQAWAFTCATTPHSLCCTGTRYGLCKWVLVPPFNRPGSNLTIKCFQRAGELLFIPEGWSHATINYGDAVGLSLQATGGFRSEAQGLLGLIASAREDGSRRDLLVHLEELVEAVPTEGMPMVQLATEQAHFGLHREAPRERERIERLF